MPARLHLVIFGDVQGVFFRAGAREEAGRIGGVTGWVRNTPEGAVEVLAEGEKGKLEELAEWCGHGPAGAVVERTEREWLPATGEFNDFRIRYGGT